MSPWISVHIFYGREQRVLLLECIAPMLAELEKAGVVDRYFFVRYWEGGPHVRLRVIPSPGFEEQVKQAVECRLQEFLASRPVFFAVPQVAEQWWRRSFILEYGEAELHRKYGPEGIIPRYPENTFHYIPYEPEYARYGGPEGMEISERHFHVSSRMALERLTWDNMHAGGVRIAQTVQIMLGLCFAFLETQEAVARFTMEYATSWYRRFFDGKASVLNAQVLPMADLAVGRVSRRIRRAAQDFQAGTFHAITRQDAEWFDHGRRLRSEMRTLIQNGRVRVSDMPRRADASDDSLASLIALLFSYVHMTNNRLGASLSEEVGMAYLVSRSLQPQAQGI